MSNAPLFRIIANALCGIVPTLQATSVDSRYQGLHRNEWSASYGENMVRSQLNKVPLRACYRKRDGSKIRLITPGNTPVLQIYPLEPREVSSVK